jgi:hypothetical protein
VRPTRVQDVGEPVPRGPNQTSLRFRPFEFRDEEKSQLSNSRYSRQKNYFFLEVEHPLPSGDEDSKDNHTVAA